MQGQWNGEQMNAFAEIVASGFSILLTIGGVLVTFVGIIGVVADAPEAGRILLGGIGALFIGICLIHALGLK